MMSRNAGFLVETASTARLTVSSIEADVEGSYLTLTHAIRESIVVDAKLSWFECRKPRKPLSHGLESKQAMVLPEKKSIPEAVVFSPTKASVNSEYRSHTAGWLPQEDMMFLPPVDIEVASRSRKSGA